ncbi:MAG: serine--tRNA ligase [Patescibacteria group bacterium]
MLDIGLFRQHPDVIRRSLGKRGLPENAVDQVLAVDELNRKTTQKLELLQAESNRLSKTKESAAANKSALAALKKELGATKTKAAHSQLRLTEALSQLPNLVLDDVPAGRAENNQVINQFGDPSKRQSTAHEVLLTKAGQLDLATAAQFSGSRYRYLVGEAATMQRRLMEKALALAEENGFQFVLPPVVANVALLTATGFFPAGRADTFAVSDGQYLSGTSEPLLLALAANQKIEKNRLPLRLVGFSTCFRQEAGSYGQDVRGMFRMHQFDKVELVSIVAPEDSEKEHQFLLSLQKKFVEMFDLPYQTVLLAAGDQGHTAAKQFDLECWFPSQQRYRETHSASNCTDFQSRSLKIKTHSPAGSQLAHTLNATLATERLLLAIVENHAGPNGEIAWPEELRQ